jgi:hypothetical protein
MAYFVSFVVLRRPFVVLGRPRRQAPRLRTSRVNRVVFPVWEPGRGGLAFYGLRVRLGPSYLLVYPTMGQPSSTMPGCPVEILCGSQNSPPRLPSLGMTWPVMSLGQVM